MSIDHVPVHLQPCITVIDAQMASLKMQFRQLKRARKLLCGDAADVTVRGSLGPPPPHVSVEQWLKHNPGWHTAGDIATAIGTSGQHVGAKIRRGAYPRVLSRPRPSNSTIMEYSYDVQLAIGTGT